MGGTIAGGRQARDTNYARWGADYYKKLGHYGGKAGKTGGFGSKVVGADGLTGQERARIAGAKGGSISKRNRQQSYNGKATCNEEPSQTSGHQSSNSSVSTSRPHLGKCGHCGKLRFIVNSGVCHKCVDYFEAHGIDTTEPGWRPF